MNEHINKYIEIKFKKNNKDVLIPTKAHSSDACFDIYSPIDIVLEPNKIYKIDLGFSVEIPHGYKLCIYSRSSMGLKGIVIPNSIGIIDADYRGSCGLILINLSNDDYEIKKHDRVAQMALEKVIPCKICEYDELNKTDRNTGGFGSTGK